MPFYQVIVREVRKAEMVYIVEATTNSEASGKACRGEFCSSYPKSTEDEEVKWVLLEKPIEIEPPQPRCAKGHTIEDHERLGWTCDLRIPSNPDFTGPINYK